MNVTTKQQKLLTVDGKVNAAKLYNPTIVTTTWLKTWAFQCGKCQRDVVRFAFFGHPRCPYCLTVNVPGEFQWAG